MGDRFSGKRVILPILIAVGFIGLQSPGRSQDRSRLAAPRGPAKVPAARTDVRDGDAGLRLLSAELRRFRSSGDAANAAAAFARLFRLEPAADLAASFKTLSTGTGRLQSVPTLPKDLDTASGTSPVFFSPEDERNPAAEVWGEGAGAPMLVSAAEQWSGGQPGEIGVRRSIDGGRTWEAAAFLGDGRPWVRPALRQVSAGALGLAAVREWTSADGDIVFARLSGDLAVEGEYPLAFGPADERSPSLVSDFQAFPSPYIYAIYAERSGASGSVRFRISPDLGTSWSEPVTIASFAVAGSGEIETSLAYDPDRAVLHAAFTCPQGPATGVAVATSRTFGASWSQPVFVTPEDGLADGGPKIAAAQGRAVVVYEHATAGNGADIGLASSSNAGRSWSAGDRLASTAAAERYPDVRTAAAPGGSKFFASYVEAGARVLVMSREAAGAGTWTTDMTLETGGIAISAGPVPVLPLPSSGPGGSAGVFWTSHDPDADILFGSLTLALADLVVTPSNRDVASAAGTTTFEVSKVGAGDVAWTAEVTAGGDWLSIQSGGSGTNAGTITAAFSANPASAVRVGSIRVSSPDVTVTPVTVTVTQAAAPGLEVTPADGFVSTGPRGGPFVPSSKDYTLRNTGDAALDWTANEGRNWLALSDTAGRLDPGASVIVTISLTANADGLSAGLHTGTVTFTNRTNDIGNTTRPVELTVTGAPGALSVTPATGLISAGQVGGPFTPQSQAYTLENTGSAAIDWSAAATEAWVSLSDATGSLSAGASVTVTVSINSNANTLTAGSYGDTVTFTNTTNGSGTTTRAVSLTVSTPPGVLTVTPAEGLTSTGPEGGPFTPSSLAYTLQNSGQSSLTWTASALQPWTSVSPGSGTLAVGATTTVTVSINAAANTLAVGDHTDTVSFVNTSGGGGTATRPVLLTVLQGPALSVTPLNRDISFTGGTVTFDVANAGSGTLTWTAAVVSGSDWLTIASGQGGTNAGTITVNAAANRTQNERIGTIRVSAAGATGSPVNVTVSQVKGTLILTLSAQRMMEKAWIIQREFARLTVGIDNPASVPVETFVVYRRSGGGGEQIVQQVDGGTVTGTPLIINDAFIEPGTSYTYRVVAIDVFGGTLAVTNEITI